MIDLHTHTLLSDGVLLPSELARRAHVKGYKAIALTDHADASNMDFVLPRIVKAARELNKYWAIKVIPGVEITHAPVESIKRLVGRARKMGAKIVVGHGETISEPVLSGTNIAFIAAGVDILAHPGLIKEEDVKLAKKRGVFLEVTTRKSHAKPNKRLIALARKTGAKLVLNTDSHAPKDLIDDKKRSAFLKALGLKKRDIGQIILNSRTLAFKNSR